MLVAEKEALELHLRSLAKSADEGRDLREVELELKKLVEPRNVQGNLVIVPRRTPDTIEALSQEALSADFIKDIKRGAKRERYLKKKKDSNYRGPLILAEGDSWLEFPWTRDNGEWLGDTFALLSLAKAGADWKSIRDEQHEIYSDGTPKGLIQSIRNEDPDIVLFSVSGNEIVGNIATYVKPFEPGRPAQDYITRDFENVLIFVETTYRSWIDQILPFGCNVILHSYDYPDPRLGDGGQWIAPPLLHRRNIDDVTLWRQIPNLMLERFAVRMQALAGSYNGKVHFVRLLGNIGTDDYINGPDRSLWNDEIHGTDEGFRKVSRKLAETISRVWQGMQTT